MKNRLLPLFLIIATIGFAAILLSASIIDKKEGKSGSQTADEYLAMVRSNQHTGMINGEDVMRARQQVMRNRSYTPSRNFEFNWKSRGPSNIGGRTRAILFDHQDENGLTIYAGSVMGGMFKSENGGNSWTKINAENGNLHVTCLAQTPNGDIYAGTGEGFTVEEYNVLGEWGYDHGFMGQGLFRSSDGENFQLVQGTQPDGENWAFINELGITSANRLYASTSSGLYYTDDNGANWMIPKTSEGEELTGSSMDVKVGTDGIVVAEIDKLCYVSPDGNPDNFILHSTDSTYDLPNQGVGRIEFAIAPTDPNIIYALVVSSQGALVNIYRSDDQGETWYVIGPGGSSNFNVFNIGNNVSNGQGLYTCVIQVNPNNPDHIIIGGINMWEGKKFIEQGLFDWKIRSESDNVIPLFPTYLPAGHHVYTFNPVINNRFLVGSNGGISMAIIGETNWQFQVMNRDYVSSHFYTIGTTYDEKILAGGAADMGTLLMNGNTNPNDAERAADIWTTANGFPDGENGVGVIYSKIYPSAVIYARYPHPARNGNIETFVRRNEFGGGTDWSANMFDDRYRSDAFISPFLLFEDFNYEFSRDSVQVEILEDTPAGTTIWASSENAGRPFQYTTEENLQQGDTIVVKDPVAARFFIGGEDRVLMTKEVIQFNKEPEWYVIANENTGFEGTPNCMHYSSDANHLFVGTTDGSLYRISNIAAAYNFDRADVTSPFCVISTLRIPVYLPNTQDEISQVITSVYVNPNNPNNVIITLGNYGNEHYVYMTDNALAPMPEFRSIMGDPGNGGLPQMPVYSSLIEMDPNNDLVMVGTEYGIYISENTGANNPVWTFQNGNLGAVPIFALTQQMVRKQEDVIILVDPNNDTTQIVIPGTNNYGVIYGATFGRGLISLTEFQKPVGIDDIDPLAEAPSEISIYPNPVTSVATVAFKLENGSDATFHVYDLNGRVIETIERGTLQAGQHSFTLDCQDLPTGTYIIQSVLEGKKVTHKFIVF